MEVIFIYVYVDVSVLRTKKWVNGETAKWMDSGGRFGSEAEHPIIKSKFNSLSTT